MLASLLRVYTPIAIVGFIEIDLGFSELDLFVDAITTVNLKTVLIIILLILVTIVLIAILIFLLLNLS